MNNKIIPILIPSYEPDERLIALLEDEYFKEQFIVLVDDGSGSGYADTFDRAADLIEGHGVLMHHEVNMGKGAALKTGFKWILENMPECPGCITADSDGQHSQPSIELVKAALVENPSHLIMGVRDLSGDEVPFKSKLGNNLILFLMRVFGGVKGTDVQTGLRGIPIDFMPLLLELNGNRFEYEIEMLLAAKKKFPTTEVTIETIYDSKENHQTHYSPIRDSARIGWILFRHFVGFMISSLSSSLVDIILFSLFSHLLKTDDGVLYVTVSAVIARIISASYNYTVNYKLVFKSREKVSTSLAKYAATAVVIMALSATFTTLGAKYLVMVPTVITKIMVDVVLFLLSYNIQKKLVF